MKHAPDMQHPLTDEWACDLYHRSHWATIPETAAWRDAMRGPWELADPGVRDVFRDRARRLLAGDLTMVPWTMPIGTSH